MQPPFVFESPPMSFQSNEILGARMCLPPSYSSTHLVLSTWEPTKHGVRSPRKGITVHGPKPMDQHAVPVPQSMATQIWTSIGPARPMIHPTLNRIGA